MDEIAIRIEHVSKEYRLGAIGGGTLHGDLQSLMARIKGREDPNSKIGSDSSKRMGERFLALDDVSFEVKKGEALGIIGHNGAGKSTLLKLLSRVTAPTKGTISYNGRIASMLEVGTGFHPELTGRENVYMNGAILGMTKAEIDRKFDQIVEFAEMEKFIDTPVKRYSSGMYVKLAFAVAAHLDSEIMVMDEVLAVGDMKFQQKCLGKMDDAANTEGRTVLYVSHNMNTIRQLCTRCIVLDHGKLIFDGDVEKAIEIYMERNIRMSTVCRCMGERASKDIDCKAHINEIVFDKKNGLPIYEDGEPIVLRVKYSAREAIKNAAFRIALHTPDGMVAGMATTKRNLDIYKGEHEFTLIIRTDGLSPGKYNCFAVIYSVNDFGSNRVHDRVENACGFEKVLKNHETNNMLWNHTTWGYAMLPEISIAMSERGQ